MKIFIYDENRVLMRTVGTPDIMQGENNATLIFMSVAGIDETNFQNYLAQFAATIGTSHPADIITDFGTYVLDGIEYKGWKYFVSSKFTQVAGALNANLILSSGGSTLISQTVTLNVNPSASGQTWNQNIDLAKWYQLLAYTIGLKNPKVGVIADSYLDTYNSEGQAGSYFYFGEDGVPHLLFVGYNEDDDLIAQTDYYSDGGAMYCRSRTFSDGEWTEWETSDQASAISVNVSGLPQLTGANTVQKAIAALAHAVYPIAFVTSLTPSPFTSVDVPNSKDKIIKDDSGQDLNVGGVLDYAFAIFGRYNTHAFDFDNTLIMTSDGAIYRMKYENGSMMAHWFNGSPAQVKAEQAIINQTLSEGIAANNNLIKNNVVGMAEISMDSDTYVITFTFKNLNGQVIATSSVDIPAEMAFVSASYDNTTKDLTFTLQNGDEVVVPLDDIVSGLASEAWVNTAIANALLPYATTSWVDSNYMSLAKGGYVNLAEAPAHAYDIYFGAHYGTSSYLNLADQQFGVKTTRNGVAMVFTMNGSNDHIAQFTRIDQSTTPTTVSATKVPFKSGNHNLVIDDDLDEANAKIASLESKIAKQESDIQYLYRQVIGGGDLVTETDSGVALTSQNFPLTVSPKALLDYVGGMCQKVNQLFQGYTHTYKGITQTLNSNGSVTISGTYDSANAYEYIDISDGNVSFIENHKYLIIGATAIRNSFGADTNLHTPYAIGNIYSDGIYTAAVTNSSKVYMYMKNTVGTLTPTTVNFRIADLTAIYGAGNEPTSTSDPRIQWLMSYLSSHPEYDAGSILTAPVAKVVSKGFNIWDEEFEGGSYNTTTGEKETNALTIRSKNFIKVLPNTTYYVKNGSNENVIVFMYDGDGNYLEYHTYQNQTFVTPSNCYFIAFRLTSTYGTTYNHDICINISNPALNGTYMPYRAPIEYPIPAEVRALEGYGYGLSDTLYNYIDFDRKMFVEETAIDGDDITILATPVETDISEYIDGDVIVVSAGGHLEFENEDDLGVPYSATYQCDPDTQEGE